MNNDIVPENVVISTANTCNEITQVNNEIISNEVSSTAEEVKKFSIDYSKRGTAKCRVCKKNISKDELRIGMLVPYKSSYYTQYRHVLCAFKSFHRARVESNIITRTAGLEGFEEISKKDRIYITEMINKENTERKPLPERPQRTKRKQISIPEEKRRKLLIPSNLPRIPVLFTNADQLTGPKMSELRNHVIREKPLIMGVCEVKPKNGKHYSEDDYKINGYNLHPVNLDKDSGRGVAVYTHESIEKSVMEIKPVVKFEEACLLELRLRGGDVLLFGCLYRSPTVSTTSSDNNDNLNRLIEATCNNKYSHICLVGDFNFRDIIWSNYSTNHKDDSKEWKFINAIQNCYLHQHVERPTRRRGNDDPSTLDLVFTDEAMQVSDIQHHAPLGKSDHDVITFNFHSYLDFSKPKETYAFKNGDYESGLLELRTSNWKDNFVSNGRNKTVEDLWREFKTRLLDLREKFVPKRKIDGTPTWKSKASVPIDQTLQNAIKEKKTSHRKWSANKGDTAANLEQRKKYTKANNKVKRLMRKAKRRFERDIANKAKSEPKSFWAFIRSRLKTKAGVGPLLADNSDKTSIKFDDKEKADILQDQFCSVFTKEPEGTLPHFPKRTDELMAFLFVTEVMVCDEIKRLNLNKSLGPDEIHPRFLFELKDEISKPLAFIFQQTLQQGSIPQDWRNAFVSPIFKKGAKNRAENYRPISLTSIVCKIMEKIIKESVLKHLLDNGLLSVKQFGFLSGRSTVTQLLKFLDKCAEHVARGKVVDTIYMDFAKAFDKVPHRRLIHKLEAYGICGNVLGWIEAFLMGRNQTVVVNGEKSKPCPVLSGVPQGSVLGPILFVIYINDLPDNVKSEVFLFADDTKIARQVSTASDSLILQDDLDALDNWSKRWLLEFNADKCHVLTIGRIENISHTHNYAIDDEELEHVFEEKDLGVTVDFELSFNEHIHLKVKKANAIMGVIRRSFSFLDANLFRKLYTTFVRPHLEYAQVVWSPFLVKHVNLIENVQKRATRLIDGFKDLEYSDRLRKLKLPTMAHRRHRGDMIEVWKHFNVYDKATLSPSFKPKQRVSRKHKCQLFHNRSQDGVRGIQQNSFYHRVTDAWNNLPADVVNNTTMNDFKNDIDEFWKTEDYDIYDTERLIEVV